MHYYQFNIGDYAAHTKGLTLLEDLAYRRLLDEYYLHERPFNGCSTTVAKEIGFSEFVPEVERVLKKFFTEKNGDWVHKAVEEQIKIYKNKLKTAIKAGKASGEARRNARSTTVQPTINHKPITNNQLFVANAPKKFNGKKEGFIDRHTNTDWKDL